MNVVDLDNIARGEFAENAIRKDFTLAEAVAIKRCLEPVERAAAKERMGSPEKFSDLTKGNALDKVAVVVGKHRTTIAKAEAIVDAAEAEPAKFGRLLEDMDRTGRVNRGFHAMTAVVSNVVRFPTRNAAAIFISEATEGGWLVCARNHGWLHGDRRSALVDAHWLASNFELPVREVA
jgi:hypothetical protein